ncbi:hypothetical protein BH24ACT5_BH24ACT5_31590 [soil metagenome]
MAISAATLTTGIMSIAGMGPRPAFLALVVTAMVLGGGLVADLVFAVERANWRLEPALDAESARGRDVSVERLKLQVVRLHDTTTPNESLAPLLVEVIDDAVGRTHGIDRRHQPDAFADAVGPDLAQFVAATSHGDRSMTRQSLHDILTRIEAL